MCRVEGDYKLGIATMGSPKVGKVNVWGQASRAKAQSLKNREAEQSMIACFHGPSRRKKSNVHFGRTEKVDARRSVSMARGAETVLHPESLRIPQYEPAKARR